MMRYRVLAVVGSAWAGVCLGFTVLAAQLGEGFGFGLSLATFLAAVACMEYGWTRWNA